MWGKWYSEFKKLAQVSSAAEQQILKPNLSSNPSTVHYWGFSALEQGKYGDLWLGLSDDPQNLECVYLAGPPLQVKNQKWQHNVQLWSDL